MLWLSIPGLTVKGIRKNFNNNKRLFCTFIDIIREKKQDNPSVWLWNKNEHSILHNEISAAPQFYCVKFQVYFCFKAKPRDYPVFLAYYVNKSAKKTFIPIIKNYWGSNLFLVLSLRSNKFLVPGARNSGRIFTPEFIKQLVES